MKHLFKNFLEDKHIYDLNEQFYQTMFTRLLKEPSIPFYSTILGNGNKEYDANPIFSTKYGDRILRIIQDEPTKKPKFHLWLDDFDGTEELVLALELTEEYLPVIERLAHQWLIERLPKDEMQQIIEEERAGLKVEVAQP